LKYPEVRPYPKCDQKRYDDGPKLEIAAVSAQFELTIH
jgi:hypothetical protein